MEFGKCNFGIGVNEGLLVHAGYALKRADIKGVLRTEITRVCCFNFARNEIVILLFLKRLDLSFCQDQFFMSHFLLKGFQTILE